MNSAMALLTILESMFAKVPHFTPDKVSIAALTKGQANL